MSQTPAFSRWRATVTQAARQVLSARWRSTLEALEAARAEYGRLYGGEDIDVHAWQKASQRAHEPGQLRPAPARALLAARWRVVACPVPRIGTGVKLRT